MYIYIHLREFVALHYERHPESVRGCRGSSCRRRPRSAAFVPEFLPFLCFSSSNLPQHRSKNPSLLVFYATRHRSKSCPSCVLGHPKKVPTEKHKKGKQKVGTKIRPKIVVFQLKIHPFLCFRQIGTAHGP